MKNNKLLLVAKLAAGLTLAVSPLAGFADVMTFHGSICQVYDPAKAGQVYTHHSGVINSSATSTVVVTCGLARDFNTDVNGANVVVRGYRDPGATSPFSCTFLSYSGTGGFLTSNTSQTSSTGYVGLSMTVASSAVNGSYAVACTIPQKSRLISLILTE